LDGSVRGAKRDVVLLNAGAALHVAGKSDSIQDGIRVATDAIDTGAAVAKLDELISVSQELSA
ncbi:MAG: anthranilate phosphoribosyltransferase, partial [Chloroflexota bacterium]